jgi:hypothetical protein
MDNSIVLDADPAPLAALLLGRISGGCPLLAPPRRRGSIAWTEIHSIVRRSGRAHASRPSIVYRSGRAHASRPSIVYSSRSAAVSEAPRRDTSMLVAAASVPTLPSRGSRALARGSALGPRATHSLRSCIAAGRKPRTTSAAASSGQGDAALGTELLNLLQKLRIGQVISQARTSVHERRPCLVHELIQRDPGAVGRARGVAQRHHHTIEIGRRIGSRGASGGCCRG